MFLTKNGFVFVAFQTHSMRGRFNEKIPDEVFIWRVPYKHEETFNKHLCGDFQRGDVALTKLHIEGVNLTNPAFAGNEGIARATLSSNIAYKVT